MPEILETPIHGVQITHLKVFGDDRGSFCEAFRASWFPGDRRWVQWNLSKSAANVVRGLHFHRLQTDYWIVTEGVLRAGLYDARPQSPTYRKSACVDLHASTPRGLIIPPGVLHGYRGIRDATIMYLLDQEYSGKDEFGIRWNDPDLHMPAAWYEGPTPTLSARDAASPTLADSLDLPK
jgi:dTDP-4-dehydrorhamnose 3,5-epimerase